MYMYYIEELSIFVWLHYYTIFFSLLEVLLIMSNTISDRFSIE